MAQVFLSYAREDSDRLKKLVRALEARGVSVFWDRKLPAGSTWRQVLSRELASAQCTVVAWSASSVVSDWVLEEAEVAKGRDQLVPVMLDAVEPPIGFRSLQAADWTQWNGAADAPEVDELIRTIVARVSANSGAPAQFPLPVRDAAGTKGKRSALTAMIGVGVGITAGLVGLVAWLGNRTPTPPGPSPGAQPESPAPSGPSAEGSGQAKPREQTTTPAAVKPYDVTDCEVLSHNYGDWKPTRREVSTAASQLATGLCYGYWELDPRRVAASVEQCATQSDSTTMLFQIPQSEGGCRVEFRAASWKDRSWIWVRSFYARGGQFGDQIDILEIRAGILDHYASQWQCPMSREAAMASAAPDEQIGAVFPAMRADWPKLPPHLRGFFCTAKLLGDDLSAP